MNKKVKTIRIKARSILRFLSVNTNTGWVISGGGIRMDPPINDLLASEIVIPRKNIANIKEDDVVVFILPDTARNSGVNLMAKYYYKASEYDSVSLLLTKGFIEIKPLNKQIIL